ncbi:glycoside hydrolase family 15 protein [Candidatus Moduliflexota bacterium]
MTTRYRRIDDYGVIGNLSTVALVGLDGSIDWLCMPFIDSPSIFAALLDADGGGRFSLQPEEDWDSTAHYLPGTNILVTRFRTVSGMMEITDFMPLAAAAGRYIERDGQDLFRRVRLSRGDLTVSMTFDPRFDYARKGGPVEQRGEHLTASAGEERIFLSSSRTFPEGAEKGKAVWSLAEGEDLWIRLRYGGEANPLETESAERALEETAIYWKTWLRASETGRTVDAGIYREHVERSALVLKLLSFEPTGAIAAAATTSLPEEVGGVRNWDYRYTWIRDTSFTIQALFNLGHISETEAFLQWVESLLSEHGAVGMQIMYGVRGQAELPETVLDHLEGYKGSRPVRIGNAAAGQKQLDIYGEIMDAALKLSDYVGKIDSDLWPFFRDICDHVAGHWHEKDAGIWEVRGGPWHFVYSKVMCWVALDRGLTIARRYGFSADVELWQEVCAAIREEVLERGWSEKKESFVQHYETENLDASTLLIPLMGFLPVDDPRVVSTIAAVRRELGSEGLLYRYRTEDGLPGGEGTFLLCSFWLVQCLTALGEIEEARAVLRTLESVANHLGLFPEEYDLTWREALGNFPQAFTHIGYINSVLALQGAVTSREGRPSVPRRWAARSLLAGKVVLNDGEPREAVSPLEVVPALKSAMNVLRGAFFDTGRGRIAYERMASSEAYREYVELSYALKTVDLDELVRPEEQVAFWINLYNVLVIHAVVDLGIRDSVKEVAGFFGRIRYRIGNLLFSPEDIEHGILRGNRRPPRSFFRRFRKGDSRLRYRIDKPDPRIHFGLVCASSSCPPIELYTADGIDQELTIAGETFLNAGGAVVDREAGAVSLSRIFRWYGPDFGRNRQERLRFIAAYLHDAADRRFLEEHSAVVEVVYQDYDWRLNRY